MTYHSVSLRGDDAVLNHCPKCGSLVFGGAVGQSKDHTVFAGSLDDPTHFKPTIAIFNRSRPAGAPLPESLQVFETIPG